MELAYRKEHFYEGSGNKIGSAKRDLKQRGQVLTPLFYVPASIMLAIITDPE